MISGFRAQISTEALFAVVIVLIMVLVISVFASWKSSESSDLFNSFSEKAECEKISSIIYSLSNSSAKPSVVFDLDLNASVLNEFVYVGEYYCDFLGSASDANISSGTWNASKNSQGVVVFAKVA